MAQQVQATVVALQVDLGEDDVGTARIKCLDRRADIGRGFNRDVGFVVKDGANAFADDRMLVDDQKPDHVRVSLATPARRATPVRRATFMSIATSAATGVLT